MTDKCKECENELLLKVADLEIKNDRLEYYKNLLIKCLDVKDELCKALREENEIKQEENYNLTMQIEDYKQALEKIEEILKYYANSTMGVKNIDGTFSLKNEQNDVILTYDPRKAQEGLKILKENTNTEK